MPGSSEDAAVSFPGSPFVADTLVEAAHVLSDCPVFVVEWHTRRILACNDAVQRVFGYSADELIGQSTHPLHVTDAAFERFGSESESYIESGIHNYRCRFRMRRKDGTEFPTENLVQVIHCQREGPIAVLSFVRDLPFCDTTWEAEHLPEFSPSMELDIPGVVFRRERAADGTDRYTYLSGRLLAELGIDPAAAANDPAVILDRVHAGDRDDFEDALRQSEHSLASIDMLVRLWAPDGEVVWLRVISRPHRRGDGGTLWDGVAIDVSREKRAEERAHWLATHDSLTGLIDRGQFNEQLGRSLSVAVAESRHVAVAQVGLRGMLKVNETYGFDAGDRVLRGIAARLRSELPPNDIIARSHGDIFLVMLDLAETGADLGTALRTLRSICDADFAVGEGMSVRMDLAIGIARFPEDGDSSEDLIRAAALAYGRAHVRPEMAYEFYADDLSQSVRRRFHTEEGLRAAIAEESLEPYFQPQVSLDDGGLVGFEALVRWQLEDGTVVSPAEFVPLAEETGLIAGLGELMLRRVAERVGHWTATGRQVPPVSVNCSAQQFRTGDFVEIYTREVTDRGIDPAKVALEITESTLVEDFPATQSTMTALAERGVHFSIDDFGTGFSSLAYLARLPFRVLKVDRSFVTGTAGDGRQRSIVSALVQMARALDLYVIAEGVETEAEAEQMRCLGCHAAQGFHYGRPVRGEEAEGWLETQGAKPQRKLRPRRGHVAKRKRE